MNISESEKKRLQSLKEKKRAFKEKTQLVQQALRNLDNIARNNKIIFDDVDKQQSPKLKRKRDLFDSDDDNDNNNAKDSLWSPDELSIKKNTYKRITLGNDARFTLDDRFIENDHQTEKSGLIESADECDLQKEKERQLDILESVLGAPLTIKSQETKTDKKKLDMIRYDPTENEHCKYEVKPTQPEVKQKSTKKKKHDKPILEIKEHLLSEPEVSKDIYYSVSDTLTNSLKQEGEFSLLKAFGKEKNDIVNTKDYESIVENKVQKFKFNFNANDAFKYDSFENEGTHETSDTNKQMANNTESDTHRNNLFGHRDTLFFDNEDVRFIEAVNFFSTKAISNEEFDKLRRELKTIVHKKILRNEKKRQLSGKKRKIRR